jgi:hypothetical protein
MSCSIAPHAYPWSTGTYVVRQSTACVIVEPDLLPGRYAVTIRIMSPCTHSIIAATMIKSRPGPWDFWRGAASSRGSNLRIPSNPRREAWALLQSETRVVKVKRANGDHFGGDSFWSERTGLAYGDGVGCRSALSTRVDVIAPTRRSLMHSQSDC